MYTAAEYAEMLIIYGECRRNAREDAREYAIRFPRRLPHPNYNVFLRLVVGACFIKITIYNLTNDNYNCTVASTEFRTHWDISLT
jgi:hypothetical protein